MQTKPLTKKQKECLAIVLASSMHAYGWNGAEGAYHNRISLGSASYDERKMSPYYALVDVGLVTLHSRVKEGCGDAYYNGYCALTGAGAERAKAEYPRTYGESVAVYMERAEKARLVAA